MKIFQLLFTLLQCLSSRDCQELSKHSSLLCEHPPRRGAAPSAGGTVSQAARAGLGHLAFNYFVLQTHSVTLDRVLNLSSQW